MSSAFATTNAAKKVRDSVTNQPADVPVLARLPRVEVPTAASKESRQFRIDRPENVVSASELETVDCELGELEADLSLIASEVSPDQIELSEPVATADDDDFASIEVTPAHVIRSMHARQQQSSTARALLGAYGLMRPLSRVIVLAVLLIASALLYVLLDDRTVQVPTPPLDHQAPSWNGGPKLTATPAAPEPQPQVEPQLALRSETIPTAEGPGGNKSRRTTTGTKIQPPTESVESNTDARKATGETPVSAFRKAVAASERRVNPSSDVTPIAASIPDSSSPVAATSVSSERSQRYPNTGYADHQLPFGNLSEILKSQEQPPVQATLTGKIKSTEIR